MAAPPLRWGVLGTGWIAERFTGALHRDTQQRVVAVGSRSTASAKEFADKVGVERAHGSYEDMVADREVDIVYVATPHNFHRAHALLALDAGKHVLVEKPIALNATDAREVADRAGATGLFCAEALWTFFLPRYDVIRQLLEDEVLGEVRTVIIDNGEWLPPTHRIFRHDLAGGPLLDLGTYNFAVASWVLGAPEQVIAIGQDVPGGEVNGQVSAVMQHEGGRQSVISTTIMGGSPVRAVLIGTKATLEIEGRFYTPGGLALTPAGEFSPQLRWTEPAIEHRGLYVTAVEAARCVAAGQTTTPFRPPADSVATLRIIDDVRRQLAITFPGESSPAVPRR